MRVPFISSTTPASKFVTYIQPFEPSKIADTGTDGSQNTDVRTFVPLITLTLSLPRFVT